MNRLLKASKDRDRAGVIDSRSCGRYCINVLGIRLAPVELGSVMEVQMAGPITGPTAGTDYPRNWTEFLDWFGSEEACLSYLEGLRWPGGFVCASCASAGAPYRSSRSRLMCRDCGRQSTVTAGTIFDKTRTPLRVWLAAAWY